MSGLQLLASSKAVWSTSIVMFSLNVGTTVGFQAGQQAIYAALEQLSAVRVDLGPADVEGMKRLHPGTLETFNNGLAYILGDALQFLPTVTVAAVADAETNHYKRPFLPSPTTTGPSYPGDIAPDSREASSAAARA